MAWLQKRGGKWWIGWRYEGKEFRKSLKTSSESEAKKQLAKHEATEAVKRANAITEEYIAAITGKKAPAKVTLSAYLKAWLKEAEQTTTKATVYKYNQLAREFSASVGAETTGILVEDITTEHIRDFISAKRATLAPGTVQGFHRILGSIFGKARDEGLIKGNPVSLVKATAKNVEKSRKRPFTLEEIKTLHSKANPFWKYMLIAGFYTGLRMGDLATLTKNSVSLSENALTVVQRKTGKTVKIPMAAPLRDHLKSIWPKGSDYFWPDYAKRYLETGASSLSQEFYDLMTEAGLVLPRDEKKKSSGKGRSAKREQTALGFHNLRHTFVSQIKISGAVDSVAKELVGHRSDLINTHYTHLPAETLANAINQLPGVGV
ncbi:MAG: tyrosine-type recombinase/integrase [Limisphaerales bacterium]